MMENAEDHLRLVYHIIKSYRPPDGIEKDDWYQIGCIGLIKACQTFDKDRHVPFSSYACKCIYNELRMFQREYWNKNNSFYRSFISLELPIKTLEDSTMRLADIIESMCNVEEIAVTHEIEEIIKSDVSTLMLQGYTSSEIAIKMKVCKRTAIKRMKKIREKVREYLSK